MQTQLPPSNHFFASHAPPPDALLGEKLRAALGDSLTAKLERLLSLVAVSSTSPPPEVMAYLSSLASEEATGATWGAERGAALGAMLQAALKQHTTAAVAATSKALAAASKLTLQAVLSLVLSFVSASFSARRSPYHISHC